MNLMPFDCTAVPNKGDCRVNGITQTTELFDESNWVTLARAADERVANRYHVNKLCEEFPALKKHEIIMKQSSNSSTLKHQYNLVDGKVVELVNVKVFSINPYNLSESPNAYQNRINSRLEEWKTSKAGEWVTKHAVEMKVHREMCPHLLTEEICIIAKLTSQHAMFWNLQNSNTNTSDSSL